MGQKITEQLQRLDRRLHIDRGGQSEWIWAIPAVVFAVWAATLLVMGVMTGVSAAEFIPTALLEGLVIAGLFVVCLTPEVEPHDDDGGSRVPFAEPPATQPPATPPADPAVWLTLLADLEADAVQPDQDRQKQSVLP